MKTLLIITGPQGSGNHVWSKIFALHQQVQGWQALLTEYWIGHDQEPFSDCWHDPALLQQQDWSTHDYYVTGISCPYMRNGERTTPDIEGFAAQASLAGLAIKLAIIGRDRNILAFQETRLRGEPTVELAREQYKKLTAWNPVYLSYELLQLYRSGYLQQISKQLDFPIDYNHSQLNTILADDTNQKYFRPVEHHWTDDLAQHTSRKWK